MATRFDLTGAAPTYTPPTRRGGFNVASGEDIQLLGRKPQGSVGTSSINVGSTAAGRTVLLHRSISAGAVKAGTLAGTCTWCIGVKESNVDLNGVWRLYVYVTSGDTDTPRGTLLSFTGTTEFGTTAAGLSEGAQSVSSVAVQAGDRIVAEIGYSASSLATTYNATINYGQIGTTDLTNGDTAVTTDVGWIEFSGADGLWTPSFTGLTDTFSTIDAKWIKTTNVSSTSGRLRIPCTTTLETIYTASAYEIQGSTLAFQVPTVPAGGNGVFSAYIGAGPTITNTNLEFEYSASTGNLVLRNNVSGTDASPTTLTYSSTTHQWWRFREASGSILMETSPDGSAWTTQRTIATPSQWMRTGTLIAHFEAQRSSGTADYAEVDNLNAGGTITIPFGTALESDSGITLTGRKTRTTGIATEADSGITLTGSKRRTTGIALEADTAPPLAASKRRTTGIATETDSAPPLTGSKRRTSGTAAETDTAIALTGSKRRTTGIAQETDTPVALAGRKTRPHGTATETDTAVALTGSKRAPAGTALETDTAHGATVELPPLGTVRTGPARTRWNPGRNRTRWTTGAARSNAMDRDGTELLQLPVYADTDPSTYPVRIAVLPPGDRPTTGDWHTATWATIHGIPHAQILIGPDGGTLTLTPGTWTPWLDITATPEHPHLEGVAFSIT